MQHMSVFRLLEAILRFFIP